MFSTKSPRPKQRKLGELDTPLNKAAKKQFFIVSRYCSILFFLLILILYLACDL